MSEINYPSDEFTDDFLRTQTDIGDQLLEHQAFQYWPTQEEMNKRLDSSRIGMPDDK